MHPVIKHLIYRKSKSTPFNDQKKITLVLFGGAMVGVRGAGMLVALEELGLTESFDEVYGMSSGFINGSYFVSGQAKECASIYYEELTGNRFINWFRFWRIVEIDYLLRVIDKIRPLNIAKILASKTKLFSILINASLGEKTEYIEAHNCSVESYSALMRDSTLLPYATKGMVKINRYYYHDILHNQSLVEFLQHVIDSDATDILVLYNYPWQEKYVRKYVSGWDDSRMYGIMPPIKKDFLGIMEKLRRFQTNGNDLKKDCQKAGDKVKKIFGSSEPIHL
jgi:predicted patatin/cPLA2 family phospholipase